MMREFQVVFLIYKDGKKAISGSDNETLLVIGAGLMRTGTTSLKLALEHLLQRPCYHMSVVALQQREAAIKRWLEVYQREGDEIETVLRGYGATVDYPACSFYLRLAEIYPHAKVC